jgi:hypothetical protein
MQRGCMQRNTPSLLILKRKQTWTKSPLPGEGRGLMHPPAREGSAVACDRVIAFFSTHNRTHDPRFC